MLDDAAALDGSAAVQAWLRSSATAHGRLERLPGGAHVLVRPRARLVIVEAPSPVEGLPAGTDFDALLLVGPAEALARALEGLPRERVQLLPLPSVRGVAERIFAEAAHAADAYAQARIAERLLDIGRALNAERDPGRVLQLILSHARAITNADAGSIYRVEGKGATLRFKFAQNDSVQADFSEFTMAVTERSVVGTAVLTRATVRVDDLYGSEVPEARRSRHDRSFDRHFGYETHSMITTPMITPDGKVLAVIQLINAKEGRGPLCTAEDFEARVRPFTEEDERLCTALAAQAATALENASLYAEIQMLFEGFVRASVHAIEQRDPTTSGHSQRVADLTVGLARAADRSTDPAFADVRFSADQLREIEYAGLLHDFGKVGVREEVLVKAKKLYPYELALVLARFDHMRTALRLERLEAELHGQFDADARARHEARVHELEELVAMVLRANEPSVLPEAASARLSSLQPLSFRNALGEDVEVLGSEAIEALRIRRGSLTEAERSEIQSHVTHTYDFLVRIPWTGALRRVPEIAGKHHEYLDGSGYPQHVGRSEIPLQARMMTIADIFDALTAADRPYKRAVPVEQALDILRAEERSGKLDADVLSLFIDAKVYALATGGGAA